jgi:hypothetical protein
MAVNYISLLDSHMSFLWPSGHFPLAWLLRKKYEGYVVIIVTVPMLSLGGKSFRYSCAKLWKQKTIIFPRFSHHWNISAYIYHFFLRRAILKKRGGAGVCLAIIYAWFLRWILIHLSFWGEGVAQFYRRSENRSYWYADAETITFRVWFLRKDQNLLNCNDSDNNNTRFWPGYSIMLEFSWSLNQRKESQRVVRFYHHKKTEKQGTIPCLQQYSNPRL